MEKWQEILLEQGVDTAACIPFSACRVQRPHLLHFAPKCAILFAVPYLTEKPAMHRVSMYAASEDYHIFFQQLFEHCTPLMEKAYPGTVWQGFSDHSPIAEGEAAARAGLGLIGDNHLLITQKYGSYIFLGEFLTDADLVCKTAGDIPNCRHCGNCTRRCPGCDPCLSALTQKKGTLTPEEESRICKWGSAWGCDICQLVCPENEGVQCTPIPFFYANRMPDPDAATVRAMSDEAFARRAFAWRGRETVLRNLTLLER